MFIFIITYKYSIDLYYLFIRLLLAFIARIFLNKMERNA